MSESESSKFTKQQSFRWTGEKFCPSQVSDEVLELIVN